MNGRDHLEEAEVRKGELCRTRSYRAEVEGCEVDSPDTG